MQMQRLPSLPHELANAASACTGACGANSVLWRARTLAEVTPPSRDAGTSIASAATAAAAAGADLLVKNVRLILTVACAWLFG